MEAEKSEVKGQWLRCLMKSLFWFKDGFLLCPYIVEETRELSGAFFDTNPICWLLFLLSTRSRWPFLLLMNPSTFQQLALCGRTIAHVIFLDGQISKNMGPDSHLFSNVKCVLFESLRGLSVTQGA